jgi:predicted transcriptional regulator
VKVVEREKARELRREGKSITDIAVELGVAKSSVSTWVRDIELTQSQREMLTARSFANMGSYVDRGKARREEGIARRLRHQVAGREKIKSGSSNLWVAGCMLYWGEGTKDRTDLTFSNSDPEMVALFLRFLREECGVEDDRITMRIHGYETNGICPEELNKYWMTITGLEQSSLRRGTYGVWSKASKRLRNTIKYGTLHIRVAKSGELLQQIYGSINEFSRNPTAKWVEGLRK